MITETEIKTKSDIFLNTTEDLLLSKIEKVGSEIKTINGNIVDVVKTRLTALINKNPQFTFNVDSDRNGFVVYFRNTNLVEVYCQSVDDIIDEDKLEVVVRGIQFKKDDDIAGILSVVTLICTYAKSESFACDVTYKGLDDLVIEYLGVVHLERKIKKELSSRYVKANFDRDVKLLLRRFYFTEKTKQEDQKVPFYDSIQMIELNPCSCVLVFYRDDKIILKSKLQLIDLVDYFKRIDEELILMEEQPTIDVLKTYYINHDGLGRCKYGEE